MIILKKRVLLNLVYYMPDHKNLVQEFIWQTKDIVPDLPRIHKFLKFWKNNIDAPIQEVKESYSNKYKEQIIRNVSLYKWH